jgi:type IX secretion system PorP/SprF family membrane protein
MKYLFDNGKKYFKLLNYLNINETGLYYTFNLKFMNLTAKASFFKKTLFILCFVSISVLAKGQQIPQHPISYRIFSPFIFNPAIAGSKDFLSVDLIAGKYDQSTSQVLSGSGRLSKSTPGYFSSSGYPEYTSIGAGGYFFNENNGSVRNTGIAGTGSYHLQLDKNALSFLSFGVTAKGIYNDYSGNADLSDSAQTSFFPEIDAGIYYYSKNLFAGVSSTNLLGGPNDADTTAVYRIPVSRQLYFQLGYKIVVSQSLNIVVEPSVIVNTDDTFSEEITDMIEPMLKVYAENFCAGTYFNDFDKYSVFFQYKYPKFYIGAYFELPKNAPFYKSPMRAEFAAGLNISAIRSGVSRINHW